MLAWRRDGTLPNKASHACPPSVALAWPAMRIGKFQLGNGVEIGHCFHQVAGK